MTDLRTLLLNNLWRQGSLLSSSDVSSTNIQVNTIGKKPSHVEYYLIISQDCDVVCADGSEPNIECLCLRKLPSTKVRPLIKKGFNPRALHIEDELGCWEIKAKEIVILAKEPYLSDNLSKLFLSDANLNLIRRWKVNRYQRTGLPENFVNITKEILSSFDNSETLRELHSVISSIRININSNADGSYDVGFIILINFENEDYASQLEELINETLLVPLDLLDEINVINFTGDFEEQALSDVMSDMEFPIGLIDAYPRYYLDKLSLNPEDSSIILDE